jgi:hypothetical protein
VLESTSSASTWNLSCSSACRELRQAEHSQAVDLAAVEQLAGDQRALDRLADAHVVGDEDAHGVLLQRHQQRHELVGPRLDGDPRERAERPSAAAEAQAHGIAQQPRGAVVAGAGRVGQVEAGRLHRLQVEADPGDLVVDAAQRPLHEQVLRRLGQHHPLAPPRLHQRAHRVAHPARSGARPSWPQTTRNLFSESCTSNTTMSSNMCEFRRTK